METSTLRELPLPPLQRLSGLLATYQQVFSSMLAARGEIDTAELDPVFTQLRQDQRQHWPHGQALVDGLGLAARDLLAAAAGEGRGSAAFANRLQAHDRAISRLREALTRSAP